jgi:hypothetical protein
MPRESSGNWTGEHSIGSKGGYNIIMDLTRRHPFQREISCGDIRDLRKVTLHLKKLEKIS